jgi:hypothetical protein
LMTSMGQGKGQRVKVERKNLLGSPENKLSGLPIRARKKGSPRRASPSSIPLISEILKFRSSLNFRKTTE